MDASSSASSADHGSASAGAAGARAAGGRALGGRQGEAAAKMLGISAGNSTDADARPLRWSHISYTSVEVSVVDIGAYEF